MINFKIFSVSIFLSTVFLVCMYSPSHAQIEPMEWPDPTGNFVIPYNVSALTHGPMLGSPSSSGMRIWIRTEDPQEFKVVYSKELPLSANSEGIFGETVASNDNTGYVDVEGLQSNTKYYYGIVLDDQLVDTRMNFDNEFPSFHTLPDQESFKDSVYNPDNLANFSFGVGFCNRISAYGNRYVDPRVWKTMLKNQRNMEFFIMNGDYIYEEYRRNEPAPYGIDLFRKDYKYHMEKATGMANFFRYIPTMFMYDDHETYSDLEGTGEIGLGDGKWLYRDRALKAWYEYAGWANIKGPHRQSIEFSTTKVNKGSDLLQDRTVDFSNMHPQAISNIHVESNQKNAGVYAFKEIVDEHTLRIHPSFDSDEEVDYSVGSRHYFDWKVSNTHFIMLDIRGERTRYDPMKVNDEDQSLLGQIQKEWLIETVKESDSEFIFIFTTVSWTMYHTNFHMYASGLSEGEPEIVNGRSVKEDGFTGAVKEREELLELFDKQEKPVLLFTGDLHSAYSIQISDNVWEFMTGPLSASNHSLATAGNPPAGGWFDSEGRTVKVKWVSAMPNEVPFPQNKNNYYGIVSINNLMKSPRANEPGFQWLAFDEPTVTVQFRDAYTGQLIYSESISTLDAKEDKEVVKPHFIDN